MLNGRKEAVVCGTYMCIVFLGFIYSQKNSGIQKGGPGFVYTPFQKFQTCDHCNWKVLKKINNLCRAYENLLVSCDWDLFNPLTPGAFWQKYIFWTFSVWIWTKLVPIYSKRHLQYDSCMSFFPLALIFRIFLLGHVQKSKFCDFWTRKWPTSF